jgi:hypothetical protein
MLSHSVYEQILGDLAQPDASGDVSRPSRSVIDLFDAERARGLSICIRARSVGRSPEPLPILPFNLRVRGWP